MIKKWLDNIGEAINDFIISGLLDSAYPFPRLWWNFKDKIKKD